MNNKVTLTKEFTNRKFKSGNEGEGTENTIIVTAKYDSYFEIADIQSIVSYSQKIKVEGNTVTEYRPIESSIDLTDLIEEHFPAMFKEIQDIDWTAIYEEARREMDYKKRRAI